VTDPRQRLQDAGYTLREYPVGDYYPFATDANVLVCDDGHDLGGHLYISDTHTLDQMVEDAARHLLGEVTS